jgi:hypothetical protein
MACVCCIAWVLFAGRDALSVPITLQDGFKVRREFYVHSNARYRVELRCSRTVPFEQLKKLLDGNLVEISITDNGTPVHLSYLGAFTNPPLGFARDYISQDIAVFAGQLQRRYTLNCSVVRSTTELTITGPTLTVGLDPLEIEGGALETSLLMVGMLFFGALSFVLWIVYFLRIRRTRDVQGAGA